MKFIHAADIHLDSPLLGFASYGDAPLEILQTATREAFTHLVNEAIEEAVDFMVIAGDLYDGTWKDYNTGYFFCREMGRLNKVGIPVYLQFGNHDAESEMTKRLSLPPNVYTFATREPSTFLIESLKVAIHGRSFKEAATIENLAAKYPERVAGWLNIGVLHTALEGNSQHASYAPCSVAELSAKGYDYWALGHVHEHAILQKAPCWVVFPGNLQGRHIRETGPKGAVLVTADETEILTVERLFVDVLRWHQVFVDARSAQTLADVVQLTGQALERLVGENQDDRPMAARVTVIGKTAAHGDLFGMEAHLRAETLAQAAAVGLNKLWVEKVRVETTPSADPNEIKARADAIADLQALLDEAPNDQLLLSSLVEELQLLVGKAPFELSVAVQEFKDIRAGNVINIVNSVAPSLIAQLAKAS